MNSPGMTPPLILFLELESLTGRRLEVDDDVAELAATAGLAHEPRHDLLDPLADRLAVGDLGLADVGLDFELAQHPVDDHLEVELAHPVDQGLAGFLVGFDLEGRVLLAEPGQGVAHLLLVGFGFRLDRDRDHGLGEFDALQRDRRIGGGKGVAGAGFLEADAGADVASVGLVDLLAAVGVHHQQPADPLGLAGFHVQHPAAFLELARVDAEIGELADVGVGHDLEGEGREGSAVAGFALGLNVLRLALASGDDAGDRRHLERRGQQFDDRVEQRLHALVLEGGAAEDGGQLGREGRLARRVDQLVLGDLFLGEEGFHQLFVVVGAGFDQRGPVLVGLIPEVLWDLDFLVGRRRARRSRQGPSS